MTRNRVPVGGTPGIDGYLPVVEPREYPLDLPG